MSVSDERDAGSRPADDDSHDLVAALRPPLPEEEVPPPADERIAVSEEEGDTAPQEGNAAPPEEDVAPSEASRLGPDRWRRVRSRDSVVSLAVRDWTLRDSGKVIGVLVAAAIFIVPVTLLMQKRGAEIAAAAHLSASYDPAALATPSPAAAASPVIVIIGDETAVRAATGVTAAQRWPGRLAKALGSRVQTLGGPGAGFATPGDAGTTFVQAAGEVPTDADVVLFVGGTNDAAVPGPSLVRAATEAVAAAARRAPRASIEIVGPIVTDGLGSQTLVELRSMLATAARTATVRWTDPVAARWSRTPKENAGDLSAADEQAIAARVEELVHRLAE